MNLRVRVALLAALAIWVAAIAQAAFVASPANGAQPAYQVQFGADTHGPNYQHVQLVHVVVNGNHADCVIVSESGAGYGSGAAPAISCDWLGG